MEMRQYYCYKCDWNQKVDRFVQHCPKCGSAVFIKYKIPIVDESKTNFIERYANLLPILDSTKIKECGEGNTPLIRAEELEKKYSFRKLWLKDETQNPTCSTKDRIASLSLSFLYGLGIKEIGVASTGNSSTAFANAMKNYPEMKLHVFCAKKFQHRHNFQETENIIVYENDSDYATMSKQAKAFCENNNIVWEGGFFNVARRDGLKTAYLEAFEQTDEDPDYVVQAISSGMGLLGAAQGIEEFLRIGKLKKTPKLIAVQQQRCCPMVKAWENGEYIDDFNYENPEGLAEAILRGKSDNLYDYVKKIIEDTQGTFVSVTDEEIIEAKIMLNENENINACYASATALAGTIKLRKNGFIGEDESVVVNITGGVRDESIVPHNYLKI
jgi:threonine synthase